MIKNWGEESNVIKAALNMDASDEGGQEVLFCREKQGKVLIHDLIAGHNFKISKRKILKKGAHAIKEHAILNGAVVWKRIGYWWNNCAEILVDYHLEGYSVWALGEEDSPLPWYIYTDRHKKISPPSFTIDDIEFKIVKPSFTFWALVAYDCHIRKYQETVSFDSVKDDWQVIRIKNVAVDEVEQALSALHFELRRLKVPGFKGNLVIQFMEEWEGYFWKKWKSSKKIIFSRKHLTASPYLMEAIKAYNEAQDLPVPWTILSLFRAIESICTQIEDQKLSRIRLDTSIDTSSFIRQTRSVLSASAEARIRNLINALDKSKRLPKKYRSPSFQAKLSRIINHRNSIAHGGSLVSTNLQYSPSILMGNPEFEESKCLLNGLAETSIKWLSEQLEGR